jgi:hypothetical protein
MKDIKEKLRDFGEEAQRVWKNTQSVWKNAQSVWEKIELKYPTPARILVYLVLFGGVILVCNTIFDYFNLFHHPSSSNLQYMLSAVVQSEAAIVAIVITLTLIAVELSAHEYSPRVVDIFKKNPDIWILLFIYGISIYYGLIVLKHVPIPKGNPLSSETEILNLNFSLPLCPDFITLEHISFALWLGIFSFVALVPYMLNIINLLKPRTIIKKLAKEIAIGYKIKKDVDLIQPIVDILNKSIVNYDFETVKMGLEELNEQVTKVIDSECEQKSKEEIIKSYCDKLERVGQLAIQIADKESTEEVLKNLQTVGLRAAAEKAVSSIEILGKATIKNKQPDVSLKAVKFLGEIGEKCEGKTIEHVPGKTVRELGNLGIKAANAGQELESTVCNAVWALKKVGIAVNYLFSWANVPGDDNVRLLRFLKNNLDIGWAGNVKIRKSKDGKNIHIFDDGHSAKITIDDKQKKMTVIAGRTHELNVKIEGDKLYAKKNLPVAETALMFIKEVRDSSEKNGLFRAKKEAKTALKELGSQENSEAWDIMYL